MAAAALLCALATTALHAKPPKNGPEPILFVVMDPLAKELACACVKDYAQRDYRKLAARLESALKQKVAIEFSDDLAESIKGLNPGREVIVAGSRSLVAHGATKANLKCHPICDLTDREGNSTLTASFVTRSDDPAQTLKDLAGRKLLFGLSEADDLHAAALAALRTSGIEPAQSPVTVASYSDAALDVLDSRDTPAPVAVIPSYSIPLLEGCGSVKPGSLRVLGRTEPVPFVAIFVSDNMATEKQEQVLKSLLAVKSDSKLLKAMETKEGFKSSKTSDLPASKAAVDCGWPDWRGPNRDAHVPRLPERLSSAPNLVWKKAVLSGGLAGLSVSGGLLILAERDFDDSADVYRCLNAENGELVWLAQFPAPGKLDYGQSPRATPVIHDGKAYLLGAFGGLRCVSLTTGKVIWQRDLPREFKTPLPTWGMCSTPLLVDDLLIVNPGATNASLVALDCRTGRTRWTTPGSPAAYSAFICGVFGGHRQIVGYDRHSLGGWDITTGERLWQLKPATEGDFNVTTPVAVDGAVLVSTENNGTRLYRFGDSGRIIPKPAAEFADLSPTTASPVVTRSRVFGTHGGLYCLDLKNGLKPIWYNEQEALGDHASFIADNDRVLVITLAGELLLLDGRADKCAIIARLRVFDDDVEVYSHPAVVGSRIYARGGSSVVCVELGMN